MEKRESISILEGVLEPGSNSGIGATKLAGKGGDMQQFATIVRCLVSNLWPQELFISRSRYIYSEEQIYRDLGGNTSCPYIAQT